MSVSQAGSGPSGAPLGDTRTYVQAIPIYLNSDTVVSAYFRQNRDEIDAITGSTLVIMMPEEVLAGSATGIAALFTPGLKDGRYPGLLLSDLPCLWLEDESSHEVIRLPNDPDGVKDCIRALTDAASRANTAKSIKAWAIDRLEQKSSDISPILRVLLRELPVKKSTERLIALVFGVIFVTAILALAVFIPVPTDFQYMVFRIVLSLAAAGFVSMTPGFLEVTVANWLRAGGALAVFVVVYFYNPAALIVHALPGVA